MTDRAITSEDKRVTGIKGTRPEHWKICIINLIEIEWNTIHEMDR